MMKHDPNSGTYVISRMEIPAGQHELVEVAGQKAIAVRPVSVDEVVETVRSHPTIRELLFTVENAGGIMDGTIQSPVLQPYQEMIAKALNSRGPVQPIANLRKGGE